MAGWMTRMTQFLNVWVIQIVVLSSLAAHLFLILLAKIRRREAIGWRRTFLWLAYQGASWFATSALGHLTLGRTLREQQLVTFWAPFLLLYLGGPDNISAYSLEDNVLSGRQIFDVAAQLVGVANGIYMHIYTHIIMGSDWPLFWASVIMLAFGVGKYAEKSYALWKSDLGSIRSSRKKRSGRFTEPVGFRSGGQLGSERALLVAHSLFHICKGAFADYPVNDLVKEGDISGEIFSDGWKEMCKVVEMELSLMYDILYTKAAVVHTWFGYGIRVASPLASAAALWLFCLYNKDGQRMGDVVITYILLVSTFLLDLGWLLTAMGSTWTYAFLKDRPRSWLHHQLLCTGRWHRFRRLIVSLDLCSWLHHQFLCKKTASYRLWSGSIGQYNLLHECTHATTSQWRALAKKFSLEDTWMEYQYHYSRGLDISGSCCSNRYVRELLFEQIWNFLKSAYPAPPKPKEMQQLALKQLEEMKRRELEEALNFDKDFQEDILIWHITTDIFLLCSDQNAASCTYVKAIKALSDYMVFLIVVRPNMVPGLKLRSTYEATRDALNEILKLENKRESPQSSRDLRESSSSSKIREKELATILRDMEKQPGTKEKKARTARQKELAKILRNMEKKARKHDWSSSLSEETSKRRQTSRLYHWSSTLSEETSKRRRPSLLYHWSSTLSEETSKRRRPSLLYDESIILSEETSKRRQTSRLYDESIILSEGTMHAEELLKILSEGTKLADSGELKLSEDIKHFICDEDIEQLGRGKIDMPEVPELIFKAWVRLLIYASIRCSRDSHAKQLSRGGELTTIVWILQEHAGILRIRSDTSSDEIDKDACSVMY